MSGRNTKRDEKEAQILLLEAAALALRHLESGPETADRLLAVLHELIANARQPSG